MKKFINHNSLTINHYSFGFTLIELVVAIAIIGVLTSFLMANFLGARERSRDAIRKSDLAQIQSALEFFRSDHGYYPPSSGAVARLQTCKPDDFVAVAPLTTIYIVDIPCDPDPASGGTNPYTYIAGGCALDRCSTYTLSANLENANDPQAPAGVYTVRNP